MITLLSSLGNTPSDLFANLTHFLQVNVLILSAIRTTVAVFDNTIPKPQANISRSNLRLSKF